MRKHENQNKHAGESTPWYGSNTCERTAVQMVRGQRSQRTEDSQTGEAGRRAARTQRGPGSHYVETPRARPFGRALCTNAVRHDSRACASPGGGTNNHRLSSKGWLWQPVSTHSALAHVNLRPHKIGDALQQASRYFVRTVRHTLPERS